VGDLPHPVEHPRQLLSDVCQLIPDLAEPGGHRRLRRPQLQHQRHQLLPGAVVQLPFDPPPGLIGKWSSVRPEAATVVTVPSDS
jgi:hypothetical protein